MWDVRQQPALLGSRYAAVPVHDIKIYRSSRGIAPLILSLGTRWEWSTSRAGRLSPGENPRYPLDMRLGDLQSQSGYFASEKNMLPLSRLESWGVIQTAAELS